MSFECPKGRVNCNTCDKKEYCPEYNGVVSPEPTEQETSFNRLIDTKIADAMKRYGGLWDKPTPDFNKMLMPEQKEILAMGFKELGEDAILVVWRHISNKDINNAGVRLDHTCVFNNDVQEHNAAKEHEMYNTWKVSVIQNPNRLDSQDLSHTYFDAIGVGVTSFNENNTSGGNNFEIEDAIQFYQHGAIVTEPEEPEIATVHDKVRNLPSLDAVLEVILEAKRFSDLSDVACGTGDRRAFLCRPFNQTDDYAPVIFIENTTSAVDIRVEYLPIIVMAGNGFELKSYDETLRCTDECCAEGYREKCGNPSARIGQRAISTRIKGGGAELVQIPDTNTWVVAEGR